MRVRAHTIFNETNREKEMRQQFQLSKRDKQTNKTLEKVYNEMALSITQTRYLSNIRRRFYGDNEDGMWIKNAEKKRLTHISCVSSHSIQFPRYSLA